MNLKFSNFVSQNKFLLLIAFINFVIVYISTFTPGYGYFIDEFYYIACANRPALGYVDHPPLAPLLLTVIQFLFGSSIYVIRFFPALAGSVVVFISGLLVHEMGGKRFAQTLSAISVACAPFFPAIAGFYSMNAYEPLFAVLILYFALKMIKTGNPKQWIIIGILMGLGMMNKHTFALFIIAFTISFIITGKWKLIFNKWFFAGSLIAFIIFIPNIIWQIQNNFPSLEFYRNITVEKNVYTPPLEFIKMQLMFMSPLTALVWIPGIIYLLVSKQFKDFRILSVFFLFVFVSMMLVGSSRPDRVTFAYPAVLTGGALFYQFVIEKYRMLKVLKFILIILLYSGLIFIIPTILPYLNYEQSAAYVNFLGINTELERGNKPKMTQMLADRIGWQEKVEMVNRAFQKLSDEEKKNTIIVGENYGQAGALELYGKQYNFPRVVSGHNNYYLWNKGKLSGDIAISLTKKDELSENKKRFESVDTINAVFTNPYVTSHENNLTAFICRGPKIPFNEMLEKGRFYY